MTLGVVHFRVGLDVTLRRRRLRACQIWGNWAASRASHLRGIAGPRIPVTRLNECIPHGVFPVTRILLSSGLGRAAQRSSLDSRRKSSPMHASRRKRWGEALGLDSESAAGR